MATFTALKMIEQIKVQDFSLLRNACIELPHGFTVITGESGAGKTLLFDAVNFALGGRPHRSLLATGAAGCEVELVIEVSKPIRRRLPEPWVEGKNALRRTLNAAGRSRQTLNGATVTVAELQAAGELMFDITGQFESRVLFNPASHLALVDAFGNDELKKALASYREVYGMYREIAIRLKAVSEASAAREQEVDFLTFQISELEKAAVAVGERTEVENALLLQRNAGQLLSLGQAATSLLTGADDSPGAYDLAAQAQAQLHEMSSLLSGASIGDAAPAEMAEQLAQVMELVQELAADVRAATEGISHEPAELKRLEDRLDELHRLERKYGCKADILPELLQTKQQRLAALIDDTQTPEALAEAEKQALIQRNAAALQLTVQRKKAVTVLEHATRGFFDRLDFPHVELRVELERADAGPDGADHLELLVSLNPGEPARPLAQVASGGEASRLMLGIKAALAERSGHAAMLLDEIEAGVGGSTSEHLAEVLHELSRKRQIIAISHLPVVAAQADQQLVARKTTADKRTSIVFEPVEGQARRQEIARMLGGQGKEEVALADKLLAAQR